MNDNDDNDNDLYFGYKSFKEINCQQIMDIIHEYFIHCYDLGLLLARNELNKSYKYDDEKENELNIMDGDYIKIKNIKKIINNKKQNYHKLKKQNKFITNINNKNICNFGVKFEYYLNNKNNKNKLCYSNI